MKIRQITLGNVRRFGGKTASLGRFGDGITCIIAPNESGKSTFFDALNALLFCGHTTTAGAVRSLQPYSGGAVEVSADVEIDGKELRIEKRFINRKMAQVTDLGSSRVLAREGEAEAWIKAHVTDAMQGPAGLLWVRQGVMGVEPEGASPTERQQLKEARRELMSSVAGQIDAVTGGRRMDAIMRRCQEALDALATSQLRPKANGAWAVQEQKVASLTERRDDLARQVRDLGQALADKQRLEGELADIEDPERTAAREEEIKAAREKLEKAEAAAREIENAERDLRLKKIEAERLGEEIDRIEVEGRKRKALDQDIEKQQSDLDSFEVDLKEIEVLVDTRKTALSAANAEKDKLAGLLRAARRRDGASKARDQLEDLRKTEEKLTGFEAEVDDADKALRDILITDENLEDLEALENRRRAAQSRREAGAAQLVFHGNEGKEAQIGESAVAKDEPIAILEEMTISLPGFGQMTAAPASLEEGDDDPQRLAGEIKEKLSGLGLTSVAEARTAVKTAQRLRADKKAAEAGIAAMAQSGAAQLRAEIAALEKQVEQAEEGLTEADAQEPRDLGQLEVDFEVAEGVVTKARSELDEAYEARSKAREEKTERTTSLRIARAQREELGDADVAPEDLDAQRRDLEQRRNDIATDARRIDEQRAQQIDHSLLESDLNRLETVRENAAREKERIRAEINQLEGVILARAEAGVEEKLGETEGELSEAVARSARYKAEVRALSTLKKSLEASRAAAREAYFEPVKKELRPLLGMLHGGADFEMDSENMLVSKILRGGVEDEIEALSGGTAEQIAILTRLAFARLYQKDGRHVPVVLDDALVHSDDERIGKMFTLLTHAARDQQIIVFSCRNRAFSDLGGERARVEIEAMA
jgi:chromosome segregation ATPase